MRDYKREFRLKAMRYHDIYTTSRISPLIILFASIAAYLCISAIKALQCQFCLKNAIKKGQRGLSRAQWFRPKMICMAKLADFIWALLSARNAGRTIRRIFVTKMQKAHHMYQSAPLFDDILSFDKVMMIDLIDWFEAVIFDKIWRHYNYLYRERRWWCRFALISS